MTTVAQALRHTKKLKGRIDEARARAVQSASFYTDSPPAFDFAEQLARADAASAELAQLEADIAGSNGATRVSYGNRSVSVAWCVRMLSELRGRIAWLKALPVKAQASMNELVSVHTPGVGYQQMARPVECKLPEAAKAALVERLQDEFDLLNAIVEASNQTTTI